MLTFSPHKLYSWQFFIKYTLFIRNQIKGNLGLDSPKFKKFLELHGKSEETLDKWHIEIVIWSDVKLYQNNVNMALLSNLARTDAFCFL